MDDIFVFLAFAGLLFLGVPLVLFGILLTEVSRGIFGSSRKMGSSSAPQEEAERHPMLLIRQHASTGQGEGCSAIPFACRPMKRVTDLQQ